jgi:protein disulfide-isomerase
MRYYRILCQTLLAALFVLGPCVQAQAAELDWTTHYDEALAKSKSTSKPIILFFTGSDWCAWCHKLEQEVLNTAEFKELAGDKFIFVTLDFPLNKPSDPKISEQNKRLQKKYDVKGFPTLVLIDSNEQEIGTAGYRPGGAKAYAEHLKQLVQDYQQYKQKISEAERKNLSPSDLKSLYLKASELNHNLERDRLVSWGLATDEKIFFLLEKYRSLAHQGEMETPKAQSLKKEILSLDPNNEKETQYEIALIEFEVYSDEMFVGKATLEKTVFPLTQYIKKFGKQDKENLWKLHMTISQVFLDKNKLEQALDHARASYESAPDSVRSEIAIAVKNIQTALKK